MAFFSGQGNAGGISVTGNMQVVPDSAGGSAPTFTPPQLPTQGPPAQGTPTLLPIEADFANAYNTTAFAVAHATVADDYIAKLGELAASLQAPVINPVFPQNLNAPAISSPVAPAVVPIVYNPPPVPSAFTGTLTLTDQFPLFTAQPPQLLFPGAPTFTPLAVPSSPSVDLNFTYPTVDVTLPTPPSLLSLDIKPFDGVTFPTLSATAPVLTAAQPRIVNYIPNAPYTDQLLQQLSANLYQRLNTGLTGTNTGLPVAVEEGIWNRSREKEYRAQADAIAALDRYESMGYAFPPGAFIDAQIKIQTESQAIFAGSARDIAVEQAKLEQENIKQAIDAGTVIESKLIDYANQTEQRRFDASKYVTEAGISIYNAQVQAFTAMIQVYRAAIDIYVAQLDGQKTIVAIYQAEIDAERLKTEINTELVQQYKIQVDAALATIEIFKGEIQIIQTQAQVENLKVSIFGEQVRAYSAEIGVYTAQVEAYKAGIEAEGTKEQAYATSASAYSTLVSATSAEINAKVEIFKAQLAAKTEEYDAYKAQVEGQAEQVRAIAAQNTAVADIYRANVQGTSSYNDALVKEWEATIQLAESITQIGVTAAQAQGQLYISTQSIITDAAKVGAQVEAQIAASALGAVTWATHRARQDSVSIGQQTSFGNSRSSGINQSAGLNSSTSTSTSSSTSAQLSTNVTASAINQETQQSAV